jgi:hypothetical protein
MSMFGPDADAAPVRRWPTWQRVMLRAGATALAVLALMVAWDFWRSRRDGGKAAAAVAEADRLDPGWRLEELEAKRDDPPPVENGALKALNVARALPGQDAVRAVDDVLGELPPETRLSEAQLAAVRKAVEPAGPVLVDARALVRYSRARYPVQWQPDLISTVLPANEVRKVGFWLRLDATARAEAGDHAGALESCRAILHASRTVGDEPTGISQLIRVAGRAIGIDVLERLMAQGEPPVEGLGDVQRWLETEDREPIELVAARGERAAFDQTFAHVFDSLAWYQRLAMARSRTMSPELTRAVGLRHYTAYVEALKLPEDQRKSRLPVLEDDPETVPIMVGLLAPSLDKVVQACARSHAQLRCAAVAVAAERHRRAATRWPDSVAQLVTGGLVPAVPRDPFDGQPIRFRRLADGLVVYSVGPDGTDDGGAINRQRPNDPGSDLGVRLWDVAARRQPPLAKPQAAPEAPP